MITEGCIDLLSAVQMGTKRSIIGLPGCVNWQPEWFHKLKGRNVLVALDNDERGQSATAKLVPVLQAVGADVGVYGLPAGIGDLNEQLQAQLGLA
jgi:DNA primase